MKPHEQNLKLMGREEQDRKIQIMMEEFHKGVDAWKRVGEILVELVDADPHVYSYIQQSCPTMTGAILEKFEQIGRGHLLPLLAMDSSPGARQLAKLPLSTQARFATEALPVMVETTEGPDVLLIKHRELTKLQRDQVFHPGGRLRTEGEQRAWLADYNLRGGRNKTKQTQAWVVTKKELVVGDVRFTAKQLLAIVSQLTS